MSQPDGHERDAEVVALLMREYETLRSEIVQRVASRMNILGFGGVIIALVASGGLSPQRPNVYIAGAAVLLGVIWLRDTNHTIQALSRHLRDLEHRVNTLSIQVYGSHVLSWETARHASQMQESSLWRLTGRIGGWTSRG